MASVIKDVGRFRVSIYTDGWPNWITVEDRDYSTNPCEWPSIRFAPEDARDLYYALGRVIAFSENTDEPG